MRAYKVPPARIKSPRRLFIRAGGPSFRENYHKEKRERGGKKKKREKRKRKRKRRDCIRSLCYNKIVIHEKTVVISRELPLQRYR